GRRAPGLSRSGSSSACWWFEWSPMVHLVVLAKIGPSGSVRGLRRNGPGRQGEALVAQVGVDLGVAAAEVAVGLGRVDGVAHREDVVVVALGHGLVVGPAVLQERLEGVVV